MEGFVITLFFMTVTAIVAAIIVISFNDKVVNFNTFVAKTEGVLERLPKQQGYYYRYTVNGATHKKVQQIVYNAGDRVVIDRVFVENRKRNLIIIIAFYIIALIITWGVFLLQAKRNGEIQSEENNGDEQTDRSDDE